MKTVTWLFVFWCIASCFFLGRAVYLLYDIREELREIRMRTPAR